MTNDELIGLSDLEIDVMKHAVGWPKMNRNFYAAGIADTPLWFGLVDKKLAYETRNSLSPDRVFRVTVEGKAALRALEDQQK